MGLFYGKILRYGLIKFYKVKKLKNVGLSELKSAI